MSGMITQELIVEPNTGISRWEVKIKHDWNYLTYFITTNYKHGPALPCLLWKCGLLADAIRINPITITSPTFHRDVFWESILKTCKNVNPLNNPKNQTHDQNLNTFGVEATFCWSVESPYCWLNSLGSQIAQLQTHQPYRFGNPNPDVEPVPLVHQGHHLKQKFEVTFSQQLEFVVHVFFRHQQKINGFWTFYLLT